MNSDTKDISIILKQAGLKTTLARTIILHILNLATSPYSAKEIVEKLPKKESIDQATVYRNLETLTKAGLVNRVNFQHDHNHFELATKKHHHHAICQNCGTVEDISGCDLESWDKQVKKISGFAEINHHALEFFGLCENCSAKTNKKL